MTDADIYNNGLIVGISMGVTAVTQGDGGGFVGMSFLSSNHLVIYVDCYFMEYKKLSKSEMTGV